MDVVHDIFLHFGNLVDQFEVFFLIVIWTISVRGLGPVCYQIFPLDLSGVEKVVGHELDRQLGLQISIIMLGYEVSLIVGVLDLASEYLIPELVASLLDVLARLLQLLQIFVKNIFEGVDRKLLPLVIGGVRRVGG